MPEDFKVVTLCGSTRFKDAFISEQKRLTLEGFIVISVGIFGHVDLPNHDWTTDRSELKTMLDRMHFAKIHMADRVHVINQNNYIGESTKREIAYAEELGIEVTYMAPPPTTGWRVEGRWLRNETVDDKAHFFPTGLPVALCSRTQSEARGGRMWVGVDELEARCEFCMSGKISIEAEAMAKAYVGEA
jgi:hypothetical protein